MIKTRSYIVLSYVLALLSLIGIWFVAAGIVNALLAVGDQAANYVGRLLGLILGQNPGHVAIIVVDKMHAGRTFAIAAVMLPWFAVIQRMRGEPVLPSLTSSIFTILFVHLILALLWIRATDEMGVWYSVHKALIAVMLQKAGWNQLETLVINGLNVHSFLVLIETIILYSLIVWLFSKRKRKAQSTPTS